MVRNAWLSLLLLGACEVVEPRGGVLDPARDTTTSARTEPGAPSSQDDGFDFEAYKSEQREADGLAPAEEPEALLEELGAEGVEVPDDPPAEPAPPPAPLPADPIAPVLPSAPVGPPIQAVELAMGVRLVATLDGTSPPRAVLGLPEGEERVVQAGDMIPEAGVVVLAVGRDLVQVAQVRTKGDHASVESVFLQSMFPGRTARD